MVIKSKAHGRMFDGSSSVRSKMQKTESVMTDVFATLVSKHQASIEKRRKVPVRSGSIWDYNPENAVNVKKSFQKTNDSSETISRGIDMDTRTENYVVKTVEKISDWRISKNVTKMQNHKAPDKNLWKDEPSILDELFPDLESFGQFTPSENVQACSKDAVSNFNTFSYEILPSEKKILIASSDSSKLESSEMFLPKKAKGLYGAPPESFHGSLHSQSIPEKVYNPTLPSGNPKIFNAGVDKHSKSEEKRLTRVRFSDPLLNADKLAKELRKESSMNYYLKPYDGHPKNGENEPNAIYKTSSSHKSTVNRKTFEEWSNERRLNKTSPTKDQQVQLDQIQPLRHKNQSTNQPKDQQRPIPPTNTTSSPLKSDIKKLQEVEADYFYGVRSEFNMDYSDNDEYLQGDAESEEVLENSKENAEPVAEEVMKDLHSKDGHLCRVSEFLEKFAYATGPSSHEFEILEQTDEHKRYDAKRKSTATHMPQKAKLNSRRNHHNSKSSLHSCNQSRYSKDSLETSDVMVSLQVTDHKGNMEEDLVVLGMEIFEIKDGFPWIFNVIPAVDMEDITLPYTALAMAIVLRCVLQTSYTLPSWDVAVEVYAIAKEYRVQKLVESCKIYFDHNPIATNDVLRIAQLVKHFEVEEVLQNAKTLQISERPAFQHPSAYTITSCTISSFTHKEPSEFSVPLFYSKGDLGSIRKSDFRNELEIESVRGVHVITGVQIKFELDSSDKGKEVLIFYEIVKGNGRVLDLEKEYQLQTRIDLKFKKEIRLRPKESVKVIILIDDIKSSWCHCLKDEKSEYESKSGMLRVVFKSHNKTSDKQSLFFMDKVFYTN